MYTVKVPNGESRDGFPLPNQNICGVLISVQHIVRRNSLTQEQLKEEKSDTPINVAHDDSANDENFRNCGNTGGYCGGVQMQVPEIIHVFERPLYSIGCEYCHNSFMCHCTSEPFVAQSGVMTVSDSNVSTKSNDSKHQNVKFADQMDPFSYDMPFVSDPIRAETDSNDADLGNFFSRPIKIAEQEWGTGTTLGFDFNPWTEYFTNPRVINRINNFNLLRCSLKVKIVINGNGFLYGRAIAHYLPHASLDELSTTRFLIPEDIVQASQMPHVYLDPTTSSGGELTLPFFYYKNNMSIIMGNWAEMGQMYIRSINSLKHANGASDQVTVSVFAWAEDVKLSVLTSFPAPGLTPQSGVEGEDEIDKANKEGIVSGPATAVSKAAAALKSIPYLAPYATATEIGARTVAKVAKSLGYCRPPVTKDPEPYKPSATSNLALCTVPDTVQKMTIDDKQELSIDTRISGLNGTDPMNIKQIAMRESYLTTFDWAIGTSPETLLWNMRLDPVTWAEQGTPTSYHFPACAIAALPFKYWTGKLRIRFQVVCSAFHKGRLKFVYDPNSLFSNEYNTNYLQIVDIADKTDFTIEIGNGQPWTLLQHADPGVDSVTNQYSTTPYISTRPDNGVLGVYVVNELTTPNSTANNDIQVNVFVSAGDDFEVFVPDDKFQNFVFKPQSGLETDFVPQSGALVPESFNTEEASAPYHTQVEKLGPEGDADDILNKVFAGEAITSFRTLLKRYNLHSVVFDINGNANNSNYWYSGRTPSFPYLRGNVPGAIHQTAALAPYNYCNTVLLHWIVNCHAGWRGSIRWKWTPRLQNDTDYLTMYATRADYADEGWTAPSIFIAQSFSDSNVAAASVVTGRGVDNKFTNTSAATPGTKGSVYCNGVVNPNLEFEHPYYSYLRYSPGKEDNWTGSTVAEPIDYKICARATQQTSVEAHCAAGEDFQVYFFTGMPPLYYEASAPAAF